MMESYKDKRRQIIIGFVLKIIYDRFCDLKETGDHRQWEISKLLSKKIICILGFSDFKFLFYIVIFVEYIFFIERKNLSAPNIFWLNSKIRFHHFHF